MFDLEPALAAAFAPAAATTAAAYFGLGLSRPEQWDWRDGWRARLRTVRPDVVVVLQGVWDARPVVVGGRTLVPGTTAWWPWYRDLVEEAVDLLSASGAVVVWVSTLAEPSAPKARFIDAVNGVARAVVARHGAVRWLDGNVVLAVGPRWFRATATAPDGAVLRLRKTDGEHLCAEGAARLAAAVRAAVPDRIAPSRAPSGPTRWRGDPRYGADAGCGA